MRYESKRTARGNVGVSYETQEVADAQAASMDAARCSGCSDCSYCSGCSRCSDCSRCSGCSGCSDCSDCSGCSRCSDCSRCSGCSGCSDCSDWKSQPLLQLLCLTWPVTIGGGEMAVGCQRHSLDRWAGFSDELISRMNKLALEFWKRHGPMLLHVAAEVSKEN